MRRDLAATFYGEAYFDRRIFFFAFEGERGSPIAASTTEQAICIGSVGFFGETFLLGRAFGFGSGVRFLVVRFLAFFCAFLKEFNVPFMPA